MFLEFIKHKNADKFNQDLIDITKGRMDLLQIGTEKSHQIFKVVINPDAKRTVCFIAGLHGDEEGGPYGVLEFLKSDFHVPKNKKVVIIPLANPVGFKKGKRENGADKDINRHFLDKELTDECRCIWDAIKDENVELLHTLHEDPGLETFYLYYTHHKELAEDLRELARKYFNIYGKKERKPSDDDTKLYGDRIYDGLIPLPHEITGTIEDKVLMEKFIPYITTESPGKAKLKDRADFNKNAIKMVIHAF
jgi:hypothetical protein